MPIRDPRRTLARAHQRGYFPLTVAIHELTKTTDDFGAVTTTLGAAVLSGLACRIAAEGGGSVEVRRADGTIAVDVRGITLKTYQPSITAEHVPVVSGDLTWWDLLSVEHDGQQSHTKLIVEKVT